MNDSTSYPKRQPQPVWQWMILFFFITLLVSVGLLKAVAPLGNWAVAYFSTSDQTFTGVITDARCGGGPMQPSDSECIKRCVQSSPDIKYALYDGHALYVLSDQSTPEKYIARKVRVRGSLSKKNNILDVKAIDPA